MCSIVDPWRRVPRGALPDRLNRVKGMPFAWSLNPYMGCVHRCTFCYVRAFERRADRPSDDRYGRTIRVKTNVADVLRAELAPTLVGARGGAIGAATDPYQPAEGRYRLTRACIVELARARTPFSIITRGPLIWRDVDVLQEAARRAEVSVNVSVPTLDDHVWRTTEPGTAPPRRRLEIVRRLVDAGIRTNVAIAPILPGLSDRPEQLAEAVRAARQAGAPRSGPPSSTCAPGRASTSSRRWRATGRSSSTLRASSMPGRVPPASATTPDASGGRRSPASMRATATGATTSAGPEQLTLASDPPVQSPRGRTPRSPSCSPTITRSYARASTCPPALVAHPRGRRSADGETAVALAERAPPRRDVMDLRMPGMDGIEATEEIMRVPDAKSSFSPRTPSGRCSQRGLESGARGYMLKEAPHETLLRAIEKVAAGETFVDPALIPALTKSRDGGDSSPHASARSSSCSPTACPTPTWRRSCSSPGDGQEPRAPHPREARGRHPHAGGRDRVA